MITERVESAHPFQQEYLADNTEFSRVVDYSDGWIPLDGGQMLTSALEIPFLGKKRILAQRPFDRPNTREPRWQLSPNVACRDRWKRIEHLQEQKEFRLEYRHCYVEFRNGNRSVVFPEGTWGPVELYGARARGAPRPRPRPLTA